MLNWQAAVNMSVRACECVCVRMWPSGKPDFSVLPLQLYICSFTYFILS